MGKSLRKITVFTGNRAEYGLIHPVLRAMVAEPDFRVSLIISGSHLFAEYGETRDEIEVEGVDDTRLIIPSRQGQVDMTNLFAKIVQEGSALLGEIKPDFLLLAGDRYETFAMAVAGFYSNIPIAHMFGGDLSQGGHLDDSVRHAVTKLAHLHFTSNEDSWQRVVRLGEELWRVFNVGSTYMDNITSEQYAGPAEIKENIGIDLSRPYLVFTQHPVTTESEQAYEQVVESLEALKALGCQTIITYPCNDAGSEDIIRAIAEYRDQKNFIIRKSLGWRLYLGCLRLCACVVGNSSSGLIETPYFKVPCVNIGTRQAGRLKSENVIDVGYDRVRIKAALERALYDSVFLAQAANCTNPYGSGGTARRILELLKTVRPDRHLLQKKMTY